MSGPDTQHPTQRTLGEAEPILVPDDAESASGRAGLSSPALAMLLVAASFAFAQLVLFDENRFLEWDEAVYISRASDGFSAIRWSAHRAEGVAWLISPVFALSSSFWLLRVWLVLTSTVAVALGFAAWLRPVGFGAPLGMAFFCGNWLTLFYGSEASPNLYVAASAVAAVGWLARTQDSASRGPIAAVGLAVAVAVLFRPSDGFVLAACVVGGAVLLHDRRTAIRIGLATFLSVALGSLPWVIEAIINFGGPVERWREASSIVESGPRLQVADHLRLVDGPLMGPDADSGFPLVMAIVLLAPLMLALVGGLWLQDRRVWLPIGFAMVLPLPYLFYVAALAPRFLLPAIALAAVGGGIAAAALSSRSRTLAVVVASVLALCVGISAVYAERVENKEIALRSESEILGVEVRALAAGEPCHVLSQYGNPQIAIGSGCTGQRLVVPIAGCQIAGMFQRTEAIIVAVVGALPPEILDAVVGLQVDRPEPWVVARIDPNLVQCEGANQ